MGREVSPGTRLLAGARRAKSQAISHDDQQQTSSAAAFLGASSMPTIRRLILLGVRDDVTEHRHDVVAQHLRSAIPS